MTAPLVSCVIPVFNGEAYLREAIDSVLAQTWGMVEVVVVDDGSTDGTEAVARSFGDRVRYVPQQNAGPAAARNRGIEAARGSLVAFLDADDLWAPERIARQAAALEASPQASYALCLIQNFRRLERPEGSPAPGYLTTGMLARRVAFERVGGFDPALGHGDSTDWFLRARAAGLEEVTVPEVLVFRRLHEDSRSQVHGDASRDEFLYLLKRRLDQRRPPLVSCVVPVYNGERFIAEALESILGQTHRRLEVIAVDDGSTDGTPGVLAKFGDRVIAIRQPNQGPAAARNTGIARASGSFIAFLDADDLWHPDKLTRQLARFRERPELMACFAAFRNVSGVESADGDPMLDPAAWPVTPFSPCTLLARREIFKRAGTFDPALRRGEDTEWIMRMMMHKLSYESMPEVLLDRRIHRDNLTREQPPNYYNVVDAIKLVLDRRRAEGW